MEQYLKENFVVDAKRPSEQALRRWRSAVSVVRNPRRRFRMVADLAKRAEAERKRKNLQEKIRIALYVNKAALHFIEAAKVVEHKLSDNVRQTGFGIGPDELAALARSHDINDLESHGGVEGLAREVSASLNDGVVSSDISLRQNIYGFNRYAEKPARSFWMFVWDALHDLTLVILMVCAVVSIGVGIATDGWPNGMYDGVGIVICILLVVMVTAITDYKQALQFKVLDKEKKNVIVQVTREGIRQKVSIFDLVVGDVVHLSIGDLVPADGILISGHSLSVDESSLSGESELVDINKKRPFLLSGTKIQDGSGKMLVTAVGMRTEWGTLMVHLSEVDQDETPLQVKLNGVATIIGKIGLAFAVITFLVLLVRFLLVKADHHEITKWSSSDALKLLNFFSISVTIIVVAVPEGLPLAVTLSLAFAMKKLMHDRALNTGSEVTKGKDGRDNILGTPTETAILEFGLILGGEFKTYHNESEIVKVEPFNSEKKKMSVLVSLPNNGGFRAFCKGASEIILKMCDKMLTADGKAVPLSEKQRQKITDVINGFACEALRTLCLAFKDMENTSGANSMPDNNYTLIAVVGIKDPIRPEVKEAVKTCLDAGITVRMVTGDNINTAKAIARECGILTDYGLVIEGADFRCKSPQELEEIIPNLQVMARSSPSDKHKLVTQLRSVFKEVVAVTGDGTNDAPALAEADIGLAMGIAGTEVAKESADVIVMDDNFKTIVNVARWGRSVYINIQKFVQFQLTVNVAALMINFISACISGDEPLTTVQLLWVNLIMDTLGALALATEPPHDGLMKRPPIGRNVNIITKTMWRNIIGQSIYQISVLVILQLDGKHLLKLSDSDDTKILNTFIFNTFVLCQVFNEINSRDMEKINVFKGIFSSWIFLAVMFSTVTFQIVIVEFLGTYANTVPLRWELWLASVLIGAASLVISVILKCIPVGTNKDDNTAKHHDGYEPLPSGPDMA
ncbi:putative calcium-transporting ATPase 11, plasma membrane-type isoform X2 [Populus trichocarpa]|uniref:putative calcium-transporting ATPase 11, plasma membrane-type isoform X2 n=1 Tax=Populus trichocarpa TaxID=3694 RepID=UPI0022784927|nr:putative calcium-transporting ATPase 11, plasma membrane-type isoform X2 [Populus trichocarpa]